MAISYYINAPAVAPAIAPSVTALLSLVASNAWKMVKIRQRNATVEANPSVTKFSKEQNDFKIKEFQEFAANYAVGQYPLNLYVLGLNYYSIEA